MTFVQPCVDLDIDYIWFYGDLDIGYIWFYGALDMVTSGITVTLALDIAASFLNGYVDGNKFAP